MFNQLDYTSSAERLPQGWHHCYLSPHGGVSYVSIFSLSTFGRFFPSFLFLTSINSFHPRVASTLCSTRAAVCSGNSFSCYFTHFKRGVLCDKGDRLSDDNLPAKSGTGNRSATLLLVFWSNHAGFDFGKAVPPCPPHTHSYGSQWAARDKNILGVCKCEHVAVSMCKKDTMIFFVSIPWWLKESRKKNGLFENNCNSLLT